MLHRHAAIALGFLVGCGSPRAQQASAPSARAAASASVATLPSGPPPQPERRYTSGAPSLVPGAAEGLGHDHAVWALSPDTLVVAALTASGSAVLFYDVDRRVLVGHAAVPPGPPGGRTFEWVSDDVLLLHTDFGSTAVYDGRRGILVGVTPRLVGAVATEHGGLGVESFYESGEPTDGSRDGARLVDLSAPDKPKVALDWRGRPSFSDLGGGRFALSSTTETAVFDERGAVLWRVAGDLDGVRRIPGTDAVLLQLPGRVAVAERATGERWVEVDATESSPVPKGVVARQGADVVFILATPAAVPRVVVEGVKTFAVATNADVIVAHRHVGALVRAELGTGRSSVVTTAGVPPFTVSPGGRYVVYTGLDGRHVADFTGESSRDETLAANCAPVFARSDAPRLLVCDDGVHVAPHDLLETPALPAPLLVARRKEELPPPRLVHVGLSGLRATCANGASATFGVATDPAAAVLATATKGMTEPTSASGGDTLVVADRSAVEAGVDVWDIPTATKRTHITLPKRSKEEGPTRTIVSADGATIATAGDYAGAVELWRASDGADLFTLPVGQYLQLFAFHPNGKAIVASNHWPVGGAYLESDTTVRVFDIATGKMTHELPGSTFTFSEDGKKLTVASYGSASVVDASTYRTLQTWTGEYMSVQLSPRATGALVPTTDTSADHPGLYYTDGLRLIDVATGAERGKISGIPGPIAWSSDDARIFVARAKHWEDSSPTAPDVGIYDGIRARELRRLTFAGGIEDMKVVGKDEILSVWSGDHRVFHHLDTDVENLGWVVERGDACATFVTDAALTAFDGTPDGGLVVRLGADLRTSECVTEGEHLEALRRPGLLGW